MNRAKLLEMLRTHFNETELRDICFMLDIDYEMLAGTSKADKTRELIAYVERRGELPQLLATCEGLRPNVSWYDPEVTQVPGMETEPQESPISEEQARERARQEQVFSELLAPVVMQLERTKHAFDRWQSKNLYLESEIIRKGNLAIRDLLLAKAHLIPPDLAADAQALVTHYDRWLEEYERVRGGAEPDLEEPFIFVGPKGYPFPVRAEQRFRECFEQLRQTLYGNGREPE
jgi:hypothetical protein